MALTKPNKNQIGHPDPKRHRNISFVKSAIRIVGGGFLVTGNLLVAGVLIILAELLGVAEELV